MMGNDCPEGRAVLFDIDGTLLDTIPLIVETYQHTYVSCLGRPGDTEHILAGIGTPLDDSFQSFGPEMASRMKEVYLTYNHARLDTHVGVFRAARSMLEALRARRLPLGVVTSKSRYSAMRSLEQFELADYFQSVIVKESTTRHKPDAEPILAAMREMGLGDPARVVFVGDSIHDLRCARNAGCRCAVVGWTAMPENELRAAGPDLWLQETAQLTDYLDTI